ncbi:zip zinc transporter [Moniliophthora roreri MCA 2997]|uniref:Zip zinc transporter n=1 Tax=Moniliophthora roreri (strain MCA 2997) TaxID=1381753 RepID=V2XJQ2_MONRO|nr:zip zinc transporter [Moniliophthora roreri MCA 2997]
MARHSSRFLQPRNLLFIALLVVFVNGIKPFSPASLSVTKKDIDECLPVQQLSALKVQLEEEESPIMRKIFAILFPFGPAWNSILGTFYISSVPNIILAFIPENLNPDTLNTMTAFATGGLLSDVFLHLVPHSFMGEHQDLGAHFILIEEKRNILIGLGIFLGFASFFMMEKTLRVLGGGDDGHHSHSHSLDMHSHTSSAPQVVEATGISSSPSKSALTSRKASLNRSDTDSDTPSPAHASGEPSKLSLTGYLNLFGDFVHNITDGLAMAASFYASPLIGATTTLACFAHEIPHEIADYSILIRSGFSKRQAMQSQFLTAVGAFVSYTATSNDSMDFAAALRQDASGILGTTLLVADLIIPFVAGGFLYIGAVAVLPTLLEQSKSGKQALREFAAMFFGVTCMFFVAWNE